MKARLSILSMALSSRLIVIRADRSTNVWVCRFFTWLNAKLISSSVEWISPYESKMISSSYKWHYVVNQFTWKVPLGILSISLSCNSMRLILFRKWNDVAGKERILLLLKSRCCRFVNDFNGRLGISEIDEDRLWDILNVNKEWLTYARNSKNCKVVYLYTLCIIFLFNLINFILNLFYIYEDVILLS